MTRRAVAVLSIVAVVLLGACGGGDDDSGGATASGTTAAKAASDVITIKGFAFSGVESVKKGATVTVENKDGTKHTFTPDHAGDFQPAVLEAGKTAQVDFAQPGTFGYHCEIHTSMKGTIEVTG